MEAMRATAMKPAYFSTYRSLKLTRDAEGVFIGEFHSGGGPLIFRAQDHIEFAEAFYRISQDPGNKGRHSDWYRQSGKSLTRARELAYLYLQKPEVTRRNVRIHFISR